MRSVLAVVAALAVTVLGAAILGEYQFDGLTGAVAGLIYGVFVAEAAVAVARKGSTWLAIVCAVFAVGGLGWAIRAGIGPRDSIPANIPAFGWAALVLAAGGAAFRARSSGRRGAGSPTEPARTPSSDAAGQQSPSSQERPAG
jgi:hypothetical protein